MPKAMVKNVQALILLLATIMTTVAPCSAGNLFCDDYGNCTGSTDDGDPINLHTDSYGNTMGSIGNDSFNSYTDDFGNTNW